MSTAIVAGPAIQIDAIATQLQAGGFHTVVVGGDQAVAEATVGLPPDSVDCYVHVAPSPAEAAAGGADRMVGTLVSGIGQLAGARSLLRSGASAVILAEGWDDQVLEALRVLAQAALSPGAGHVTVQAVSGLGSAVESFASLRAGSPSPASLSLLADVAPDLAFADWRDEIMSVTTGPTRSYLGWTTPDGRQRAAVLSGAVISPLAGIGEGTGGPAWGEPGPGATVLAEAILADALRIPDPSRPGTSLSQLAAELSEAFAKETVMHLPLDSFEFSAAEVMGWARRHLCGDEPELVAAALAPAVI